MAYRDDIQYIEDMDPDRVAITAAEYARAVRMIDEVAPFMGDRLWGLLEWVGTARDRYEQRLKDAVDIIEALRDAYDKAGRATGDYAAAQQVARRHVADGAAAEQKLAKLIGPIASTQSAVFQEADPLRQWEDLRVTQPGMDWVQEVLHHDEIEKVRIEAEKLWSTATIAYDLARRTEVEARADAVAGLRAAYRLVPDFKANPADAAKLIADTPGLAAVVRAAECDPNARRPTLQLAEVYQVTDEQATVQYPDHGWQQLAGGFLPFKSGRLLTASEARLLDQLSPSELYRFTQISNDALGLRFGGTWGVGEPENDGHDDAYRHVYWTAMLIREFGEDWAIRFTTAHERPPGPAAREAMDLYNDDVGRSIALANPDASPDELLRLAEQAVGEGRAVVIGPDGLLAYSDQVDVGATGTPHDIRLPAHQP